MKELINRIQRKQWQLVMLLAWLSRASCPGADSPGANRSTTAVDYEEPRLLIGNILASDAGSKQLLFKSQRTATRSGQTVRVMCEYTYPDGKLAARDRIVYEAGQLASFETEEFQTVEKGSAVVRSDPGHPGKRKLFFEYTTGQGEKAKTSRGTESLENETLVDDMIPVFIVSHWDALMKGSAAKFRYVVPARKETVGFRLIKDSALTWEGKPAVRIKMEPTSIIIAQLVDPLFFVVEEKGMHRVLEYIGRTTPVIRSGNKWKDLDARTVFEWK